MNESEKNYKEKVGFCSISNIGKVPLFYIGGSSFVFAFPKTTGRSPARITLPKVKMLIDKGQLVLDSPARFNQILSAINPDGSTKFRHPDGSMKTAKERTLEMLESEGIIQPISPSRQPTTPVRPSQNPTSRGDSSTAERSPLGSSHPEKPQAPTSRKRPVSVAVPPPEEDEDEELDEMDYESGEGEPSTAGSISAKEGDGSGDEDGGMEGDQPDGQTSSKKKRRRRKKKPSQPQQQQPEEDAAQKESQLDGRGSAGFLGADEEADEGTDEGTDEEALGSGQEESSFAENEAQDTNYAPFHDDSGRRGPIEGAGNTGAEGKSDSSSSKAKRNLKIAVLAAVIAVLCVAAFSSVAFLGSSLKNPPSVKYEEAVKEASSSASRGAFDPETPVAGYALASTDKENVAIGLFQALRKSISTGDFTSFSSMVALDVISSQLGSQYERTAIEKQGLTEAEANGLGEEWAQNFSAAEKAHVESKDLYGTVFGGRIREVRQDPTDSARIYVVMEAISGNHQRIAFAVQGDPATNTWAVVEVLDASGYIEQVAAGD